MYVLNEIIESDQQHENVIGLRCCFGFSSIHIPTSSNSSSENNIVFASTSTVLHMSSLMIVNDLIRIHRQNKQIQIQIYLINTLSMKY